MSNVLSEEKKKQVIALGQLGWSLRQIEKALGVRRETVGEYLRAAGVGVRPPGGWGKKPPPKLANEVTTDPAAAKPANGVTTDSEAKPTEEPPPPPTPPAMAASVSEPFRELIENGLARGRNVMSIWQDMVDRHGFTGAYESVKRFVRKLRGRTLAGSPRGDRHCNRAKKRKSITAPAPRSAIRNSGKYRRYAFVRVDAWATAASAFASSPFNRARASGPNCMSKRFADSVAR